MNTESTKSPIRILVADDNQLNQMMIRFFLQKNDLSVESAENGAEAIRILGEQPPFDLVLMDIQMPEMDGLQATRHIREVMGSAIPIIGITASDEPDEIELYLQAGMNECLSKPIEEQSLLESIRKQTGG